jgi:hypothetical protein
MSDVDHGAEAHDDEPHGHVDHTHSDEDHGHPPHRSPLIGTWRLESWVSLVGDGTEALPMGPSPEGLLAYAPDGTMLTAFGQAERALFGTDDVTGGTADERSAAFESFIAYGGRYELDGSTVIHTVEVSLFPNWIGTTQRRHWEVDEAGDRLTLVSPPISVGGQTRSQRLVWRHTRR